MPQKYSCSDGPGDVLEFRACPASSALTCFSQYSVHTDAEGLCVCDGLVDPWDGLVEPWDGLVDPWDGVAVSVIWSRSLSIRKTVIGKAPSM